MYLFAVCRTRMSRILLAQTHRTFLKRTLIWRRALPTEKTLSSISSYAMGRSVSLLLLLHNDHDGIELRSLEPVATQEILYSRKESKHADGSEYVSHGVGIDWDDGREAEGHTRHSLHRRI